jgi:hypothetical protein
LSGAHLISSRCSAAACGSLPLFCLWLGVRWHDPASCDPSSTLHTRRLCLITRRHDVQNISNRVVAAPSRPLSREALRGGLLPPPPPSPSSCGWVSSHSVPQTRYCHVSAPLHPYRPGDDAACLSLHRDAIRCHEWTLKKKKKREKERMASQCQQMADRPFLGD